MRITLQLDDDVLAAARVLARQRQSTIGDVISDLADRPCPDQQAIARKSIERSAPDCRNCP